MRKPVAMTALVFAVSVALAADPPTLVNYQGVLRDSLDKPRAGAFDMVFRFFDAQAAGNEILMDSHTGGGGNVVTVSGGLFNVQLGGGTVTDGSGPGSYTALDQVFRDYGTVWLEIKVGAETLSPRVRVQSAAYALNASNLQGKNAASFLDTSATSQTKGGRIAIADPSSSAGYGLTISTPAVAAVFGSHTTGGAKGYLGYGTTGVWGEGTLAGGYFADSNNTGSASVGYGDYGIQANGNSGGGTFSDNSGNSATVASSGTGLLGRGTSFGGEFHSTAGAGSAYAGVVNYGIQAYGTWPSAAGYFQDVNYTGQVYLAGGDEGLAASGSYLAGEFTRTGTSVKAFLGALDSYNEPVGVYGYSNAFNQFPSYFYDNFFGNEAWVGGYATKVLGNGSVDFIQNHPFDRTKTIVYAAPEGDETAVYTRGTARLKDGEARVTLGDTFAWVANPDVGLTATVTPRGKCGSLYVTALSSSELTVRSDDPAAGGTAFDYMVWGLRIGFEDRAVVQTKRHEAFIPSHEVDEIQYAGNGELRRYSALSRFSQMREEVGGVEGAAATPLDLTASRALESAIHVYDRKVDGKEAMGIETRDKAARPLSGPSSGSTSPLPSSGSPAPENGGLPASPVAMGTRPKLPANTTVVTVAESVAAGDVLSNDPEQPGVMMRASIAADPGVVGIVAGESHAAWSVEAPIALAGAVVLCNVDATYGEIHPNDLLVASPTRGYAMRTDAPRPGTIVAKALEPWPAGTGTIRVLALAH